MVNPIYIYALCDPRTGAICYVGKTGFPKRRLRLLLTDTRKSKTHIWISSLKSIKMQPTMEFLETVESAGDWQEAERFWISYLRSLGCNLCNTEIGGFPGRMISAESRAKISASMKGRKLSEDHLRKIKEAGMGRRLSAATKEKIRLVWLGRKHSAESIAKMRAANLGKKMKPLSLEVKEKIRAAKIGVRPSAETLAKLRAAQQRRRQREASAVSGNACQNAAPRL